MAIRALASAILMLSTVVPAHAAVEGEGVNRSFRAVRTAKPPVIDGHFEEEVWGQVEPDDRFTQNFPDEGGAPTEKTEFSVLYDDDKLYVAVRCWDRDPDGVSVRLTRRDRDIETDWLALYIDSRHDHSNALVFQLSAAGVMVDGQMFNDTDYNADWDAVWYGKVSRDKDGWNAEFAIPLSVLRFGDKPIQEWGFQVHRNISRRREWDMWVHAPRGVQGTVSRFGHLSDIRGLEPRRTFELRPYFVTRLRARAAEGGPILGLETGTDFTPSWDVGADLKLGLTSRLTLDATINPDFGQVEADQVVLNLTRFETFFPEKRPFFLEGREVFETPFTMFYPRRIGRPTTSIGIDATVFDASAEDAALLVTDTQAVTPIWTAAKVTGGLGDQLNLGVLGAVTGAEEVDTIDPMGDRRDFRLAPPRFFGVLRGKYSIGKGAHVGVTATAATRLDGEMYRAAVNHDAYAQAVDVWWRGGPLRLEGQAVVSERIGGTALRDGAGRPCEDESAGCVPIARADGTRLRPGDVGYGAILRGNYQTPEFFGRFYYNGSSPRLDLNAVGFQPQFNQHYVELIGGYVNRKPGKIFQFYNVIPVLIGGTTWDGTPTQAIVGMDFEALTRKFWFTSPQLLFHLPGTWDPFETLDGALFERPARLDFNWFVETNPSKGVYANLRVHYKRDLDDDGSFVGAVGGFRWQAMSNMELSLDPEIGREENALRFFDCATGSGRPCLVESMRNYTFADLDTTYFSATFRGTYTLSTDLSVQAYAQLFLATGTYRNAQITTTTGERPEIERDQLAPAEILLEETFDEAALNVNLVLRWEPDPGTVLFFVYTRDQQAPSIVIRELDTGPTEEVVLLKLVYFIS